MKKHNEGFSLVECLVAIVLLGALVVPISTSLVTSIRVNEKTDAMLQAQLDVSSALEHLMAEGISGPSDAYDEVGGVDRFPDVKVVTAEVTENNAVQPYYSVTVTSNDELVTVTTFIRKNGGGS